MRGIGALADGSVVAELVAGLAEAGHRRFLHVAGSLRFASARGRKETCLSAIERLGLESHGVVDGDWSDESGREAVRSLPEGGGVTVVIAGNDRLGRDAMARLVASVRGTGPELSEGPLNRIIWRESTRPGPHG
ncbi:hypothetical protein ACFWTE_01805 [Nocardiopsis sp. NPDC058631]|uniref:hypothetical protein n=1 Tax=Nocardiopsis sp. NPDC058631 TaxID=3346566 RepID=UPI003659B2D1